MSAPQNPSAAAAERSPRDTAPAAHAPDAQQAVADDAAATAAQADSLDAGGKRNWWLLALGPVAGLVLALVLPASLSFEGRAVANVPCGWRSGG
ncbi:hypothetical protein [Micrococcus terreus]|uniref:hypothetical protein n=1 Tax=Micrococcus terreus TaxID=574650 RepID=UPI00301868EE